jgi:large subunit ribosomal protein L9
VTIEQKAGVDGRLFGSVTSIDISEAITASGVEVKRHEVRLPNGPLKAIGEYELEIALHHDVVTPVKIVVVALA